MRSRFSALCVATLLIAVGLLAPVGTASAYADTGNYPYASMPCELSPYSVVGYCTTKNGPYDWGPVKNGSVSSQVSAYGYGFRNCTDYVAWKLASLGVQPAQYKGLKSGKTWGTRALAHGVVNNSNPAVGSVAVSTAGSDGHVAFVTAVSGNQITVSQYNQAGDGTYSAQTGTAASLRFSSFDHFEQYETGLPQNVRLTSVSSAPGTNGSIQELFATGSDGNAWLDFEYSNGQWSGWNNWGQPNSVQLTSVSSAPGTNGSIQELFATGSDGNAWLDFEYSNGQWSGWNNWGQP